MSTSWTEADHLKMRTEIEAPDYEKEIYVISAPRCANTITRYIVEHLTSYESYGYIGSGEKLTGIDNSSIAKNIDHRDPTGIIFKRHTWQPHRYTNDKVADIMKVIAVVRNPLDWRRRDGYCEGWGEWDSQIISHSLDMGEPKAKIFFYEKLMKDPKSYVSEIAEFISADQEKTRVFLENIEHHIRGKKAPEQNNPNALEPNLSDLRYVDRVKHWNALMRKFPTKVRDVFEKRYGHDGSWIDES